MRFLRLRFPVVIAAICLAAAGSLRAADEPKLTKEEKKEFLLNAKVVHNKQLGKGVTSSYRLTLSDGKLTHDAHFQPIDIHKPVMQLASGRTELNFVDSFHYNIAAYELAELLGLGDMVPVSVQRRWEGRSGAITWWIPWKWDEEARLKEKIQPPDADAWNNQMYKLRVFNQLVYDTDPNLGNWLITEDWKLWRIDFTRAFRLYHDLENPKNLVRCDRQLLEKLRQLDAAALAERTKGQLNKEEVKAVMARRDKIVAYFEKLIAEKGESQVLY
jgi:hypothetical protein